MTTTSLDTHPLSNTAEQRPPQMAPRLGALDWRQAAGGALIAIGVIAICIGWFGVSGTLDPGKQMPYLSSGGIGGAAMIALGVTLLISFEHAKDREALGLVLDRLSQLEERIDGLATKPTKNTSNNGQGATPSGSRSRTR